jgi:predicted phage gp36 major capsid-like protein
MASNLTDEQRKFYEEARQRTKSEVEDFEAQIKVELDKVKERIQDLQNGAKAARQMYDATCLMLGAANELEDQDSEE